MQVLSKKIDVVCLIVVINLLNRWIMNREFWNKATVTTLNCTSWYTWDWVQQTPNSSLDVASADVRQHVRPSVWCEGCYFICIPCSGLEDYRRNWKRGFVCPRCEEPQSRPINSQLACLEARTGSPEHMNCSFCRSTLGRSRVERACCGPLHVKCSAGMNRAKTGEEAMSVGVASDPRRCKNWTRTIILPACPNWSIRRAQMTEIQKTSHQTLFWTMQVLD